MKPDHLHLLAGAGPGRRYFPDGLLMEGFDFGVLPGCVDELLAPAVYVDPLVVHAHLVDVQPVVNVVGGVLPEGVEFVSVLHVLDAEPWNHLAVEC
jgi:hypothetical protein